MEVTAAVVLPVGLATAEKRLVIESSPPPVQSNASWEDTGTAPGFRDGSSTCSVETAVATLPPSMRPRRRGHVARADAYGRLLSASNRLRFGG